MSTFEISYLALIVAVAVVEIMLLALNKKRLNLDYSEQPKFVKEIFDVERFSRMQEYQNEKICLGTVQILFSAIILLIVLWFDIFGVAYFRYLQLFNSTNIFSDALFFVLIVLALQCISLPISAYNTFVTEARYGFNTTTIKRFITDLLKSMLIGLPLLFAVICLVLWIFNTFESMWWLVAACALFLIQLIIQVVYPKIILPIFYIFTPLDDAELTERAKDFARSSGVSLRCVEKMNASSRSKHGNAFFTGLWKSKRLVIFDTLLDQLSKDELLAVIAHEFGHAKRGHIIKNTIFSFLLLIFLFYSASTLLAIPAVYEAFGFWRSSGLTVLVLLSFASAPVFFLIQPLSHYLSRKFEFEADEEASKLTAGPQDLKSALLKLYEKNLANPVPHPLYAHIYFSHPSLEERVAALEGVN